MRARSVAVAATIGATLRRLPDWLRAAE